MHDLSAVGRLAIKNASRRKKHRWHRMTWHLSECAIEIRDRDPTTILSIRCTVNGRPKRNSPVGTRHARTPSAIAQYLYRRALRDCKSTPRTETEAPLRSITDRNGKLCTAGHRQTTTLTNKIPAKECHFFFFFEKFWSFILVSLKNTSSFLLGDTPGVSSMANDRCLDSLPFSSRVFPPVTWTRSAINRRSTPALPLKMRLTLLSSARNQQDVVYSRGNRWFTLNGDSSFPVCSRSSPSFSYFLALFYKYIGGDLSISWTESFRVISDGFCHYNLYSSRSFVFSSL